MKRSIHKPSVPRQPTAPAAESASPLAFQSVLSIPSGDGIIPEVRRVTGQWLSNKFGAPAPLETGTHFLRDHVVLTSQASYQEDGAEHGLRIQLREDNPEATWRVSLFHPVLEGEMGWSAGAVTRQGPSSLAWRFHSTHRRRKGS